MNFPSIRCCPRCTTDKRSDANTRELLIFLPNHHPLIRSLSFSQSNVYTSYNLPGAKRATDEYFNSQYLTQAVANSKQVWIIYWFPSQKTTGTKFEYLAAWRLVVLVCIRAHIITNIIILLPYAHIAKYADPTSNPWNKSTNAGARHQNCIGLCLVFASTSHEENDE